MRHKLLYSCAFLIGLAGCATGPAPAPSVTPAPATGPAAQAVFEALLTLGADYQYGGRSPITGFDCSGLVAHVFGEAWALRLPHNARAQSMFGKPVGAMALEPGDLVFYNTLGEPYSHVGIYLGNGRFIHAPKAGQRVRIEKVSASYWRSRFNGARRLEPPKQLRELTNDKVSH
jgi:cell wall-associated NlpC family hydrolase